jgi:hypothetical protein
MPATVVSCIGEALLAARRPDHPAYPRRHDAGCNCRRLAGAADVLPARLALIDAGLLHGFGTVDPEEWMSLLGQCCQRGCTRSPRQR